MNALDALGNPVRRQILELLRDHPRPVTDIAAAFPISRPAVSRHLRVLSSAGLVEHATRGTRNVYSLRVEGFEAARSYIEGFWDEALARYAIVAQNLDTR